MRGRCVDSRRRGGGHTGVASVYILEDSDGERHACDYTDLVSDGFRTLEVGDEVRYEATEEAADAADRDLRKARYVVRLVDHSTLFYQEVRPPSA